MRYLANPLATILTLATALTSCELTGQVKAQGKSSSTSSVLFESSWPKFRGNMEQNGSKSQGPTISSAQVWSYKAAKGIFSSPVVGPEGNVYIGSPSRNKTATGL